MIHALGRDGKLAAVESLFGGQARVDRAQPLRQTLIEVYLGGVESLGAVEKILFLHFAVILTPL